MKPAPWALTLGRVRKEAGRGGHTSANTGHFLKKERRNKDPGLPEPRTGYIRTDYLAELHDFHAPAIATCVWLLSNLLQCRDLL